MGSVSDFVGTCKGPYEGNLGDPQIGQPQVYASPETGVWAGGLSKVIPGPYFIICTAH